MAHATVRELVAQAQAGALTNRARHFNHRGPGLQRGDCGEACRSETEVPEIRNARPGLDPGPPVPTAQRVRPDRPRVKPGARGTRVGIRANYQRGAA